MTGIAGQRARSLPNNSIPSTPGILTSRKTRSGVAAPTRRAPRPARGRRHLESLVAKEHIERFAHAGIVVDHEDSRGGGAHKGRIPSASVVSFRARAMDPLHVLKTKPRRLVAGLMSGTSADGIDCAICSIEGGGPARDPRDGAPRPPARVKLEAFRAHPYDASLRRRILGIAGAQVREIAALHAEIGDAFAEACLRTLVLAGIPEEALDLVGSHGQTIYHHNGTEPRVTLQIGDGDRIAESWEPSSCPISARATSRPAARGPRSPLCRSRIVGIGGGGRRPVVLNLGGIANVTILDPDPRRIAAFDTGPANAPLDRLARLVTGGEWDCDFGGKLASEGGSRRRSSRSSCAIPSSRESRPSRRGPRPTATRSWRGSWRATAAPTATSSRRRRRSSPVRSPRRCAITLRRGLRSAR